MANTKSIIDYRYAPKDIKDKIVRADGLVRKSMRSVPITISAKCRISR